MQHTLYRLTQHLILGSLCLLGGCPAPATAPPPAKTAVAGQDVTGGARHKIDGFVQNWLTSWSAACQAEAV